MALDPMVDVSRWHADWDKQVSSLDKEQAQLIDNNAKIFQDQISTLTREFGNMRQEIETLKHKIVAGSAMEAEDNFDRIGKVEKVIGHPNDLNIADRAWHKGCNKELSAREKHSASLEERVEFIERQIGDSADNHEKVHSAYKELQESFKGEKVLWETTHSTLTTQIETLADSVDKHSRELEVVKGCLADTHGKVESSQGDYEKHKTLTEGRLGALETGSNEVGDKYGKDLEALNNKIQDLFGLVSCEKMVCEKKLTSAEECFEEMDKLIPEFTENQEKSVGTLGKKTSKVQNGIAETGHLTHIERTTCEVHNSMMDERLGFLQRCVTEFDEKNDKTARDIASTNSKFKKTQSQMKADSTSRENNLSNLEEQIIKLEAEMRQLHEKGLRSIESLEANQTKIHMSARDSIMESVMEVLDREMKAISAMHSNQMQLIQQQTQSRQLSERNIMNVIGEVKEEIEHNQGELENITKQTREDREQERSYVEEALRMQWMKTQSTLQEARTRAESLERTIGFLDTSYRKEREERIAEDSRLLELMLELQKDDDIPNPAKATLRRDVVNYVSAGSPMMALDLEAPAPPQLVQPWKPGLSGTGTPMQLARTPLSGSMEIIPIMQEPPNVWSPSGSLDPTRRTTAPPRLRSCASDASTLRGSSATAPMSPLTSVRTMAPATAQLISLSTSTAQQQSHVCDVSTTQTDFASAPMAPMTTLSAPTEQQRVSMHQVTMSPAQMQVQASTMPARSMSPASSPPPTRTSIISRNASIRGRSPFNPGINLRSVRASAASGLGSPINHALSPTRSETGRTAASSPTNSEFSRSGRNSLGTPNSQRKERVQITCGTTRYNGKRGSGMKVPVGVREEGESTDA